MTGSLPGKQPAFFINVRKAEYQAYRNKQALEKARAECVERQKIHTELPANGILKISRFKRPFAPITVVNLNPDMEKK